MPTKRLWCPPSGTHEKSESETLPSDLQQLSDSALEQANSGANAPAKLSEFANPDHVVPSSVRNFSDYPGLHSQRPGGHSATSTVPRLVGELSYSDGLVPTILPKCFVEESKLEVPELGTVPLKLVEHAASGPDVASATLLRRIDDLGRKLSEVKILAHRLNKFQFDMLVLLLERLDRISAAQLGYDKSHTVGQTHSGLAGPDTFLDCADHSLRSELVHKSESVFKADHELNSVLKTDPRKDTRREISSPLKSTVRAEGCSLAADNSVVAAALSAGFSHTEALEAAVAADSELGHDSASVGLSLNHPVLVEPPQVCQVKSFSGLKEDFEEFENSWNLYMQQMQGHSALDIHVLTVLKSYLDSDSASLLEARMHLDPSLSYRQFWGELRNNFHGDAQLMYRQKMRHTRLKISGSRISFQDWATFQSAYVALRSRIFDWTDLEDWQHVGSQLPPEFLAEVAKETRRRQTDIRWVRVVVPQALPNKVLLEGLASFMGHAPEVVQLEKGWMIVSCQTDLETFCLLGMDGILIQGFVVHTECVEYHMSGDQIFDFVSHLLKSDEDLVQMGKHDHFGCPQCPEPVVLVSEPKRQPGQGSLLGSVRGDQRVPRHRWLGLDAPVRPQVRGSKGTQKGRRPSQDVDIGQFGYGKSFISRPPGQQQIGHWSMKSADSPGQQICFACRKLGKPHKHDHQCCPESQARRRAKKDKFKSSAKIVPQDGHPIIVQSGRGAQGHKLCVPRPPYPFPTVS